MRKKTNSEFIEEARRIHGDKYDYSKVEYKNADEKVCIICPEHGEFWQSPYKHLNGQGCPTCAGKNKTVSDFITKARSVHGDRYDYSKVKYEAAHKKVCIICPEHGEFWQTPSGHLSGRRCPKCAKTYMDTKFFIEKAKKIHGNKYDYSKTEYVKDKVKVCIICPEHGEFWQDPSSHLSGCGCPKCGGSKKLSNEEFIAKSQQIHGHVYDYSMVDYINRATPVKILCKKHGAFYQKPSEHLSGCGCPKCGLEKRGVEMRKNFEDFVSEAKAIHGEKYEYDETHFTTMRSKTLIKCPEHGEFWQEADSHLRGCGCPKCSAHESKKEDEIYNFIKENLSCDVIKRDREAIAPKEIDVYIPSLKVGIEYNGIVWHSDKFFTTKDYHINKLKMCEERGIKLIQIFEDDYLENEDLIKKKLSHIVGFAKYSKKVYGRNCAVKEIENHLANDFLSKNHIQGYSRSSIYLGAFYDDNLCAVMTFKKSGKVNKWELNRFATDNDTLCVGVGGKIFKYFVKKYHPLQVVSFADRNWTSSFGENFYTKIGFIFDGFIPPDYKYFSSKTGYKRVHKFNFRKKILNKKYGLPLSMTESEMTKELGYYKIWDCGLIRYVWTARN